MVETKDLILAILFSDFRDDYEQATKTIDKYIDQRIDAAIEALLIANLNLKGRGK